MKKEVINVTFTAIVKYYDKLGRERRKSCEFYEYKYAYAYIERDKEKKGRNILIFKKWNYAGDNTQYCELITNIYTG